MSKPLDHAKPPSPASEPLCDCGKLWTVESTATSIETLRAPRFAFLEARLRICEVKATL